MMTWPSDSGALSEKEKQSFDTKKNPQSSLWAMSSESVEQDSSTSTEQNIQYLPYVTEEQLYPLSDLIAAELSEPYSIYTYRYFLLQWPEHCFLAVVPATDANGKECHRTIGGIICKLSPHHDVLRGYIAMLVVAKSHRKHGIASHLVNLAIESMKARGCQEVVLETEVTNQGALHLYQKLGFLRDKRLCRYYLNGCDAFRLKFFLPPSAPITLSSSSSSPAASSSSNESDPPTAASSSSNQA